MSELFTELTDQQQELVAGGLTLDNFNTTDFTQIFQASEAVGASASGPAGSISGGSVTVISSLIETSGTNDISVTI